MVLDWYQVTMDALQVLWNGFILFAPRLIGAIVVLIIGWFISVVLAKGVTEVLKRLRFNRIFERGIWKEALAKAEFNVDAASFIGGVVKWVLVIVFLMAAVEILKLQGFALFLKDVLAYLPNIVVASFIFVVAVIIADILEKIVRATVETTRVGHGHIVGVIVRWSIWVFALFAILTQLQVVEELIQTLFTGIIAVIVISAGLAFGLGGKEIATEVLRGMYRKLKG
ncbi:MAG: hypothetical protein ABH805_00215 [Candidatus Nealsonbacteria bacterium]